MHAPCAALLLRRLSQGKRQEKYQDEFSNNADGIGALNFEVLSSLLSKLGLIKELAHWAYHNPGQTMRI